MFSMGLEINEYFLPPKHSQILVEAYCVLCEIRTVSLCM